MSCKAQAYLLMEGDICGYLVGILTSNCSLSKLFLRDTAAPAASPILNIVINFHIV